MAEHMRTGKPGARSGSLGLPYKRLAWKTRSPLATPSSRASYSRDDVWPTRFDVRVVPGDLAVPQISAFGVGGISRYTSLSEETLR